MANQRDFSQLQERLLNELEKIAFSGSEKVSTSQKLTALRLLAKYIGMDKGVKPEKRIPMIIDDITDPRLSDYHIIPKSSPNEEELQILQNAQAGLNREQRRALQRRKSR